MPGRARKVDLVVEQGGKVFNVEVKFWTVWPNAARWGAADEFVRDAVLALGQGGFGLDNLRWVFKKATPGVVPPDGLTVQEMELARAFFLDVARSPRLRKALEKSPLPAGQITQAVRDLETAITSGGLMGLR